MVALPGGSFRMGSAKFYREERPQRLATVGAFAIELHRVTNRQFSAFVAARGYVTFSERQRQRELYPEADPELLVPGSLVFTKPDKPTSLRDYRAWWSYLPGA